MASAQEVLRPQRDGLWKCTSRCTLAFFKRHIFIVLILSSLVVGISLGVSLRTIQPPLGPNQIIYLQFPGEIFMRLLKMLLIPLVVSSLISATTTLSNSSAGKMGLLSLAYYIGTTMIAVVLGLSLSMLIKPGAKMGTISSSQRNITLGARSKLGYTLLDIFRNLVPRNIFSATFQQDSTVEVEKEWIGPHNETIIVSRVPTLKSIPSTNMLGLMAFSLFFGVTINSLKENGRHFVLFFATLNLVVMKMIYLVIWYAPIGVVSLIATKIVQVENPVDVLQQLSWLILTVLVGIVLHCVIVLPVIFVILTRRNPYVYLWNMLDALVTVFSTASSAATLPVTMRCLIDNNKVDKRVVHFVAPVGVTVNMDGTAMYLSIASVFLAQTYGMDLDAGQLLTIALTSIAGSIGAAGVPSSSLVVIVMILTAVGIPTDIGLLTVIDWLLDRFRGLPNIEGDSFAAGIVDRMVAKDRNKDICIYEEVAPDDVETADV